MKQLVPNGYETIVSYISNTIKMTKAIGRVEEVLSMSINALEEEIGFMPGSVDEGIVTRAELYSAYLSEEFESIFSTFNILKDISAGFGTEYSLGNAESGYTTLANTIELQLTPLSQGVEFAAEIYKLLQNNLQMSKDLILYGFKEALDTEVLLANPSDISNEVVAGFEAAGYSKSEILTYCKTLHDIYSTNKSSVHETNMEDFTILANSARVEGISINILSSLQKYICPHDILLVKNNQLAADDEYLARLAFRKVQGENLGILAVPNTFKIVLDKSSTKILSRVYENESDLDIEQLTIAAQLPNGFDDYYAIYDAKKDEFIKENGMPDETDFFSDVTSDTEI